MPDESGPDVIVRLRTVEQFAGKKRSQIYDDIRNGLFPRPLKLTDGGRAVGWLRRELLAWQQSRIAARDDLASKKGEPKTQPQQRAKKAVRR
jgi:prophage regulatory protein